MCPLNRIKIALPEYENLEKLAALLQYHQVTLTVTNAISSDSGDNWQVTAYCFNSDWVKFNAETKVPNIDTEELWFISCEPTLRLALSSILDQLVEFESKYRQNAIARK